MPRIVVILPTQTYRAAEFIQASQELGVELVVASEGEAALDMGSRYIQIDCSNPVAAAEAIVTYGDGHPIDGIVAADDSGVVISSLAGTRLGLPANSHESASATRDKAKLRTALASGETPQPKWTTVAAGEDPVLKAESDWLPTGGQTAVPGRQPGCYSL